MAYPSLHQYVDISSTITPPQTHFASTEPCSSKDSVVDNENGVMCDFVNARVDGTKMEFHKEDDLYDNLEKGYTACRSPRPPVVVYSERVERAESELQEYDYLFYDTLILMLATSSIQLAGFFTALYYMIN
jgi:hypothetical protein